MNQVFLVTGGSSGIGRCVAAELHRQGCTVYELSRRNIPLDGVTHLTADVTDETAVTSAVIQVMEHESHIDGVVNCAGFGISGAIEFTELSQAKSQFEVNFFGMVNVNRAVLPIMRAAGKGRIVNISSVAAVADIPFQAFYSASKAAVNSYTCSLANEVRPFGITVTALMPGDIRTGFTAARRKSPAGDEEYHGRISRSVAGMEKDEANGMTPEQAAQAIVRLALRPRVNPLYSVGFGYQCICVLIKFLPCRLRNWVVGQLYAK